MIYLVLAILSSMLVSVLMLKSGRFRQLVCGSPTVVIERGQVLQKAMRRLRLTTEDLFEQLRQKGVFYLEDVAWAIVETNGMLSVIRRPEEEPVTPKELGLSPARAGPGAGAGVPDDGAHRWQVEGDRKKYGHGAGQVKQQRYV